MVICELYNILELVPIFSFFSFSALILFVAWERHLAL